MSRKPKAGKQQVHQRGERSAAAERRREIPLMESLIPLGRSYGQVLRLIARRELLGRRDANGRWWADAADVDRFIRKEKTMQDAPDAA